jgi:hypothetical protein
LPNDHPIAPGLADVAAEIRAVARQFATILPGLAYVATPHIARHFALLLANLLAAFADLAAIFPRFLAVAALSRFLAISALSRFLAVAAIALVAALPTLRGQGRRRGGREQQKCECLAHRPILLMSGDGAPLCGQICRPPAEPMLNSAVSDPKALPVVLPVILAVAWAA